MKGEHLVFRHQRREGACDLFGFVGGFGDDPFSELLEEVGCGQAHEDLKCSNPCVHGKAVFVSASINPPIGAAG